jgi:hypothetical protein
MTTPDRAIENEGNEVIETTRTKVKQVATVNPERDRLLEV